MTHDGRIGMPSFRLAFLQSRKACICVETNLCHLYSSVLDAAERGEEDSEEFRVFKKQLYHAALARILSPLRPGMLNPHIVKCPDGFHRRAIFQLGPFIADYPEQVYLAGVVQGWCPKCGVTIHHRNGFDSYSFRDLDVLPDLKIWRRLEIPDSVSWMNSCGLRSPPLICGTHLVLSMMSRYVLCCQELRLSRI